MRFAVAAALAGLVATAAAQQPQILNSNDEFSVIEGEPWTIEFSGCPSGCTIELGVGTAGDLQTVSTLSTDATGESIQVTLDVPSGNYALKIIDNSDPENVNYSRFFPYQSTVVPTVTAETSTTEVTSTVESTVESTATVETTVTTAVSTAETTVTTATSTTSDSGTTTSSAPEEATTIPSADDDGAGAALQMPLVAGALAALVYLF